MRWLLYDRGRGFAGDVVKNTVDVRHLVDNVDTDTVQYLKGDAGPASDFFFKETEFTYLSDTAHCGFSALLVNCNFNTMPGAFSRQIRISPSKNNISFAKFVLNDSIE